MSIKYTDEQIAFVLHQKRVSRRSYEEVQVKYNKKFDTNLSEVDIRQCFQKYQNAFEDNNYDIKKLKDLARAKKSNSFTAKENRTIIQAWNDRDDILDAVKAAAKDISKLKIKTLKLPKSKKKKHMTKELLLSDIHFGKLITEGDVKAPFNLEICKARLHTVVQATIGEIVRDSKEYNIDEIVIALLGDIIENYSMHVLESARGCEFGNSKQVYEALINIFKIVIVPLNQLGIKMRVAAVTGNHDRDGSQKTFNNPGEENFTHIIYNTLKDFCEIGGLKNIEFIIAKDPWAIIQIYGNNILYEHYDNCKNPDRKALEALMTKRAHQLCTHIDYMRGGHFHEPTSFRNGRMQINGCLTGNDSYASVLGFSGDASQTVNSYVDSNRRYKMYRSFNILLE
jgi:predicted phosphodiesterase